MTSEEFKKRFQKHPLGYAFQSMEITETLGSLGSNFSIVEGMLMLLEFQGEITKPEYEFLREALRGNAQRNKKRIEKTNSLGTTTKQ